MVFGNESPVASAASSAGSTSAAGFPAWCTVTATYSPLGVATFRTEARPAPLP